jgi:hypothetical protein
MIVVMTVRATSDDCGAKRERCCGSPQWAGVVKSAAKGGAGEPACDHDAF